MWMFPPDSRPVLLPDGVHVWCAALDHPSSVVAACQRVLAADERARAGQFYFERDRRRFTVARAVLRTLLGRYIGEQPSRLRLSYGPRGKPALSEPALPLCFNVSHSHELALYAFGWERAVGVDLEHLRPIPDVCKLAHRFFSAREYTALCRLPEHAQQERFFAVWTRKEAFLKARGTGLAHGLSRVEVSFGPGEPATFLHIEGDEVARWYLRDLSPSVGYMGALVVEQGKHGAVGTVALFRFQLGA
jgi:4'-phosphopantetheinyl transferase